MSWYATYLIKQALNPLQLVPIGAGVYGAMRNVEDTPEGGSKVWPAVRGAVGGGLASEGGMLGGGIAGGAAGAGLGAVLSKVLKLNPRSAVALGGVLGGVTGGAAGSVGLPYAIYHKRKQQAEQPKLASLLGAAVDSPVLRAATDNSVSQMATRGPLFHTLVHGTPPNLAADDTRNAPGAAALGSMADVMRAVEEAKKQKPGVHMFKNPIMLHGRFKHPVESVSAREQPTGSA